MPKVALSLGSNLGNRTKNLLLAIARLKQNPRLQLLEISSFHETIPVGGPPQGNFLNAALTLQTDLSPTELLNFLKKIEVQGGRKPGPRFGPRPIDLDILFFDALVLKTSSLQIPHPRMLGRSFVLDPLSEIAPGWVHPETKKTVESMKEELQSVAGQ